MKIKFIPLVLFLILLLNFNSCYANIGVSAASGTGNKNIHAYRANLQRAWCHDCYTANNARVGGYWEFAFTRLNGNQAFPYYTNKHSQVVSLSAAIRLKRKIFVPVYLDLGLGGAYMTEQEIGGKELGSNLLFEDRLGLGVLLGKRQQWEIGYRLVHYSNAYLAQKNQGLNLHLLLIGYWFN